LFYFCSLNYYNMYVGFLHIHDTLRWLLLIGLLITLTKYLAGWLGNKPWKRADNILGIAVTTLMDLQLITGLTLYFFLSPITKMALSDFGAAMKNPDLRFYAVEHFSIMVIAVILVHIGRAKSKSAKTDEGKFKAGSIFYLIALMVIFAAIPWSRLAN
jgi:Na+-driven multidrug efflux pump